VSLALLSQLPQIVEVARLVGLIGRRGHGLQVEQHLTQRMDRLVSLPDEAVIRGRRVWGGTYAIVYSSKGILGIEDREAWLHDSV